MGHFEGDITVTQLDDRYWILSAPLLYYADDGTIIGAPPRFVTDFASIPRALWTILSPYSIEYGKAAIIHDRMYETHERRSRAEADALFYEAMGVLGAAAPLRWMLYGAVRTFGAIAYDTGHARRKTRQAVAAHFSPSG
jgi:hypothetical protein